jgi:hypothetical protein
MENIRKGSKVKKILDGVTSRLKLKDYIMFEDNWIGKNDKILYNEKGVSFSVLDFEEIKENTLILDTMPYESGWRELKFSCVKLDKSVNVGEVFYTYI